MYRKYDLEYDPVHEIVVTVGGSEGIDLALRAMINPGDEVILPEPAFVSYLLALSWRMEFRSRLI